MQVAAAPEERTSGVHVVRISDGASRPWLTGEIHAACDAVDSGCFDAGVVIELCGAAPGSPVPGGSVSTPMDEARDVHEVTRWEKAVRRLERLDAPVAICVDGECRQVGLDLVLVADLRLASPGARLGMASAAVGGLPTMALFRLARCVGPVQARRVGILGLDLDADAAVAAGVVDRIAGCDAVSDATEAVAELSAGGRELAIRRRLISDSAIQSFEDALGAYLAAADRAIRINGTKALQGGPR
jgi:isomerase DpgB